MIYKVELPDVQIKEYAANIIEENMLTQVESNWFVLTILNTIIYKQKDESVAVLESGMYVATLQRQKRYRKTTVGWSLLLKWADK